MTTNKTVNEFYKDGSCNFIKLRKQFDNNHKVITGNNSFTGYLNISIKTIKGKKVIYLQNTAKCKDNWSLTGKFVGISKGAFNYRIGDLSIVNFQKAMEIASKCNQYISDNLFTKEIWLTITNQTDKPVIIKEVKLTFNDIFVEFLKYFEKSKKHLNNYEVAYTTRFKKFEVWLNDNTLFTYDNLLDWFITINHSYNKVEHINQLIDYLKFKQDVLKQEYSSHLLVLEKYKKDISKLEYKKHNSYVPKDNQIVEFFNLWYNDLMNNKSKIGRYDSNIQASLRALNRLKIMAIYGLRCHEIVYILNWSDPVLISNNEFIEVPVIDNDIVDNFNDKKDYLTTVKLDKDYIIPAITDPTNTDYWLVIGDGKTGKRIIFPSNKQWIHDFNLLDYKTLKDCIYYPSNKNSNYETTFLEKTKGGHYKITDRTVKILSIKHNQLNYPYPFTSHKLRHASVIRLHKQGYPVKCIADNHGHSVSMTTTTYVNNASQELLYDNQKEHFTNHKSYQQLEQENKQLKQQLMFKDKTIETLTNENTQLKQELTDKALNVISINR